VGVLLSGDGAAPGPERAVAVSGLDLGEVAGEARALCDGARLPEAVLVEGRVGELGEEQGAELDGAPQGGVLEPVRERVDEGELGRRRQCPQSTAAARSSSGSATTKTPLARATSPT